MHKESTKVTVMSRWPLRQVWLYIISENKLYFPTDQNLLGDIYVF
jgi:hypothetical protein